MRSRRLLALLGVASLAGCTASSKSSDTRTASDEDATPDTLAADDTTAPDSFAFNDVAPDVPEPVDPRPPAVCRPAVSWAAGQAAFRDISESAGLRALNVNGIRLSSADLDGDGDPDLVTRSHVTAARDDFAPGGTRYTFVLRNDGGVFTDITESSGLLTPRAGTGGRTAHVVVFGDADNDGHVDVFTGVNPGSDAAADNGDRSELLLGRGDGTFELAAHSGLQEKKLWALNAAAFTDADRDGDLDLFVAYGTDAQGYPLPDRLYAGDGTGAFTDQTTPYGFSYTSLGSLLANLNAANTDKNSWGALAADLNGDGGPDFVTSSYGRAMNGLWLTEGFGVWKPAPPARGVAVDGDEDWHTNLNAQCYCHLLPDAADCAGVPAPPNFFGCSSVDGLRWSHDSDREPYRLGGNTFTHAVGDLDGDGDLDLVEADIVHWDVGSSSDPSQILVNDGEGGFSRGQILAGEHDRIDWNDGDMTAAIFDFDSDGRPDIYVGSSDYPGTHGRLYHQEASGEFVPVPAETGLAPARSQGLTVADFDGDGDLDVAVGHGTARCADDPSCLPSPQVRLYENTLPQGNALTLSLVGTGGSNRSAIGARVRVTAGGRTQTQELGGGYGHYGLQNDLVLHFGLGDACEATLVEVRWPDAAGTTERFEGVRANYRVTLTQGAAPTYGGAL